MENSSQSLPRRNPRRDSEHNPEVDSAKAFRTIISVGGGRLHFLQTVNALQAAGVDTSLILGLVPNPKLERLYTLLGRAVGRKNLGAALRVRTADCRLPTSKIISRPFAEVLIYGAMAASRCKLLPEAFGQAITWKHFGRSTRKYLKDAQIFHVRSGAGQGGAISTARRNGLKVVVDHSIAHPAYMQEALEPGYHRLGRIYDFGPRTSFWKLVLKDCAEADLLLVNSDFVRETFIARGYPESRIAVAYLGVPVEFCGVKQNYNLSKIPRLLFTGAFGLRKGADTLLAALKHLEEWGQPCELHVIGHTPEPSLLDVHARDGTQVIFHGVKPQQELKSWIVDSDLYVFPTLAEGCAKSAMEAMAAGLTVVTTRACGLPGTPDLHFLQSEVNNPRALAKSISDVLQDHRRRESVGRGGAKLVASSYQWDNYAAAVKAAYRQVLDS